MKNIHKIVTYTSMCALFGHASAGAMAEKETIRPSYIPFVSLEGSYTGSKGKQLNFARSQTNSLSTADTSDGFSNSNENPWGGRLAGGISLPYSDAYSIVAESGWNYFDNASNYHQGTFRTRTTGVDLLAGIDYRHDQFGLFARAGTLFQQATYEFYKQAQGNIASEVNNVKINIAGKGYAPGILPEVKVGALYHINQNWDISLSYMHAFGADPKLTDTLIGTSTILTWNFYSDLRNPTLDSALLGIHYNFVRLT